MRKRALVPYYDAQPPSCQSGGCVANNVCNGADFFVCANNGIDTCACASTIDPIPQTVCLDLVAINNPENCDPCTASANCPSGQLCIAGNANVCGCASNFCVPLCGEGAPRSTAQSDSGSLSVMAANKGDGRMRRRRR